MRGAVYRGTTVWVFLWWERCGFHLTQLVREACNRLFGGVGVGVTHLHKRGVVLSGVVLKVYDVVSAYTRIIWIHFNQWYRNRSAKGKIAVRNYNYLSFCRKCSM